MIIFIHGIMGAGKSAALIEEYENATNKDEILILKLTSKEGLNVGYIRSRNGKSLECDGRISPSDNLYLKLCDMIKDKKIEIIMIDEIQFLSKEQMLDLITFEIAKDISFVLYGLTKDYKGEYFEPIPTLLNFLPLTKELIGYCECGEVATVNARYYDEKKEKYCFKGVCEECSKKILEENKKLRINR